MITKKQLISVVAVAVFALGIGQAQAATYDLNLTGNVAAGAFGSADYYGFHYDNWSLALTGLDPTTVVEGDRIHATITLDQDFTIPASGIYTWFDLMLNGSPGPSSAIITSNGLTSYYNDNTLVTTGGASSQTSAWNVTFANVFHSPNNTAITFDKVITDFEISTLEDISYMFDYAQLNYHLCSDPSAPSVPEPSTLLLLGAGLVGLGFTRKRFSQK